MSTETGDPAERSTPALVSGVFTDLVHLVEKQFELTRTQIEEELRQRTKAMAILVLAWALLFIDAIVFSITLAHLLHWAASPTQSDPAGLPLWACYAAVTVMLSAGGGFLVHLGQARYAAMFPRIIRPRRFYRNNSNGNGRPH